MLLKITFDFLSRHNRLLSTDVAWPDLYMLDFHRVIEAHLRFILDAFHVVDITTRVLKLITPWYKEEISRYTESTAVLIISVDVTEVFVMGHSEMEIFIWTVIEDKVSVTEWNLVVEFMSPTCAQIWELFIRVSSKYDWLPSNICLNNYDHISLIIDCLDKLFKLSRSLILVSLILENEIPSTFH